MAVDRLALRGDRAVQRPAAANDTPAGLVASVAQRLERLFVAERDRHDRVAVVPRLQTNRNLAFDAFVKRQIRLPARFQLPHRLVRQAVPPFDLTRFDLQKAHERLDVRVRAALQEDLRLRFGGLAGSRSCVRLRHDHAELPAYPVLARRGRVRIEDIALVQHRIGNVERRRKVVHRCAFARSISRCIAASQVGKPVEILYRRSSSKRSRSTRIHAELGNDASTASRHTDTGSG